MEIYDDVVIYPYIIEMDVTHNYYTLYWALTRPS
jgi:hypothetical protein